jgi:hypothetical protein
VAPAIDMTRLSYPLECFEQSDTVLDGLNDGLTFPRAHPDSEDPAKLDLFSETRFTKHCKPAPHRPTERSSGHATGNADRLG